MSTGRIPTMNGPMDVAIEVCMPSPDAASRLTSHKIDGAKLKRFHGQHFPGQDAPKSLRLSGPNLRHESEVLHLPASTLPHDFEDENLGSYDDGVKRTLTDEQITMFRHSEIQRLLLLRRIEAEASHDDSDVKAKRQKKGRSGRPKTTAQMSADTVGMPEESVLESATPEDNGRIDLDHGRTRSTLHRRKVVKYEDHENDLGKTNGTGDAPGATSAMSSFVWPQLGSG